MSRFLFVVLLFMSSGAFAAPSFMNGQFVVPNESDFQAYSQLTKPASGALVSVGTFRGLVAMGQIDFSLLVQMDIDQGTVNFNLFNRDLLKNPEVTDRFSYLMKLFGRELNDELLQQARAAQISDAQFLETVWKLPKKSMVGESALAVKVRWTMSVENPYGRFNRSQWTELYEKFSFLIRKQPGSWRSGFMGDDEKFQKIKRLAMENRIVIFKGSLTDSASLDEVKQVLSERKTNLAMLDVSNVFDYVKDQSPLQVFTDGLRRMPWSRNGSVVLTLQNGGYLSIKVNPKVSPNWTYFQLTPEDAAQVLRTQMELKDRAKIVNESAPLIVNALDKNQNVYRSSGIFSCHGVHL